MQHSTIAAIATAPGAGGIAIVRLSGPESYEVAAKVFRPANPAKKVADAKGYTAMFGAFVEGEEAFDEGVALFFRAPHSYTGEDVVELSCHGGSAVARRLVEACIAAGASPAAPGEYPRRAFLNGKLSLTQAEAVMDIISADGRQGAALANASLNGALARKIAAQKDALTALQAHLAAWVDFPEEDVPELSQSHLCDVLGEALIAGLNSAIAKKEVGKDPREIQMFLNGFMQEVAMKKATENAEKGKKFLEENAKKSGVDTLANGIQYKIIKKGEGAKPAATDMVKVHYRGTLIDGTEFDSSIKRGEPVEFPLNRVIPGWTTALQQMPVGSKWEIFIPSDQAYGPRGNGSIGPNETLIFEVELLDIVTPDAKEADQK